MSNEYLASVVWQRATMSERERRDYEEATGRLAAAWSRGLDRAFQAVRITGSRRRNFSGSCDVSVRLVSNQHTRPQVNP